MKRGLLALVMIVGGFVVCAQETIVDSWNQVETPPAPSLSDVVVDPGRTALLVLDVEHRTVDSRSRALAILPHLEHLLAWARQAGLLVVYSNTLAGDASSIRTEVKPLSGDPVVKASVDKFYKTDLESILRSHKITRVVITGVAAEGAVLATSIAACVRGFQVVVPVDGMASSTPYAEQYVAWHLLNAPGTKGNVVLTRVDKISR